MATYAPIESEKRFTAVIQALAGVFLFIPPAVALNTRTGKRSPYVKYWSKVCLCWSLIATILMVTAVVCSNILNLPGPAIVVAVVHFVFCITGALSSYFNSPFRYWFVAHSCCRNELGNVYGQLLPPAPKTENE